MYSYTDPYPPQQRAVQESHLPEWCCILPLGFQQEPTQGHRGGMSLSDMMDMDWAVIEEVLILDFWIGAWSSPKAKW